MSEWIKIKGNKEKNIHIQFDQKEKVILLTDWKVKGSEIAITGRMAIPRVSTDWDHLIYETVPTKHLTVASWLTDDRKAERNETWPV